MTTLSVKLSILIGEEHKKVCKKNWPQCTQDAIACQHKQLQLINYPQHPSIHPSIHLHASFQSTYRNQSIAMMSVTSSVGSPTAVSTITMVTRPAWGTPAAPMAAAVAVTLKKTWHNCSFDFYDTWPVECIIDILIVKDEKFSVSLISMIFSIGNSYHMHQCQKVMNFHKIRVYRNSLSY